ncbi:MAG: hypothetical protein NZ851_03825 [Aquificaceae bacterium]|nr:hypothetical protein [Aquificaceae bacterium]
MRSWVYYIELLGRYKDGKQEKVSAVYVVAIPEIEPLAPVEMECYASEYAPAKLAINYGRAYALGVDEPIKNPQDYRLVGYREDLELYIFEQGISFEEGLEEAYRLLYNNLKGDDLVAVMPIVDVGSPPEEIMLDCLKKVLSA